MYVTARHSTLDVIATGSIARANPTAAILAAAMLLDWLGEGEAAKAIERSVGRVLESKRCRTPDLGELGLTLRA